MIHYVACFAQGSTHPLQPFSFTAACKEMPGKDVQHLPWPKMLCSYALLLFSCVFVIAVYLGTKDLVHSEDELLEASVLHPLFNTEVCLS